MNKIKLEIINKLFFMDFQIDINNSKQIHKNKFTCL